MELTVLTIQKFRTYNKASISFSLSITVFVGPNAIGKTNIIEAITFLSTGKSFRAVRDADVVSWGEQVGRIRGHIFKTTDTQSSNNKEEIILEMVITSGMVNGQKVPGKKYTVNGVARRQMDFIGNLRSVLFSPTDLELITESPSRRREYLNTVLTQVDREYRRNLQSYERGLRQRNSLLEAINEGKASRSQLFFWNQLLIKTGSYITEMREAYIHAVNQFVLDDMTYRLVYDPSYISEFRLDQYKDEEIAAKTTLVGPQRDDFRFEKTEPTTSGYVDVSRFGSRGEQRLAILWVKLAELAFIEQQTGVRPILLLDDIFSELDDTSRKLVLSVVDKQQTVITSAEEEIIKLLPRDATVKVIHLPLKK